MTAKISQAEKFYQKLQDQYSRKINLDRSRIFLALKKLNIDPVDSFLVLGSRFILGSGILYGGLVSIGAFLLHQEIPLLAILQNYTSRMPHLLLYLL